MANFLRNHLKSEFAQIPNELIEDRTLSATARALFCYLAVKPDNWEFYMPDISDGLRISKDTLRKVIKELEVVGWITDDGQDRKSGQFGPKIISIFAFKSPKQEGSRVGIFPNRKKTASEKNRVGKNTTHNNNNSKKQPISKKYSSPQGDKGGQSPKILPTLADIADQHQMTIGIIEDYVQYRLNSGGIENQIAFEKHLLRKLSEPYSDESAQLEEWFNVFEMQKNIIDHLVDQFLSTQRFDRRFCRELVKGDFTLKANNIVPSDVVIEIAYQKAEAKRRERIGGSV